MQVGIVIFCLIWAVNSSKLKYSISTGDRIARHGYPWEKHTVVTEDGYILNLFRMPYSHRLGNKNDGNKSAVLLQHGLLASSDSWVLNGPNDGLPFLLVDAGHDVWIGNARGTRYSQQHVNKSNLFPQYWDFSWHEIGYYDMPAYVDYIRETTGQDAIHYVGHSQGTTTFMVLLATRPEYNDKIKTSHLLAPAIFMGHMASTPIVFFSPLLQKPGIFVSVFGNAKFRATTTLTQMLAPHICRERPGHKMCTNILFILFGGISPYLNDTLLDSFYETHPADASIHQVLHYLQERNSKEFRYYDYGTFVNMLRYRSTEPPLYNLQNVQTKLPINFYYSDNDDWVAVEDIHHLSNILASRMNLHEVTLPKFNHLDFLFSNNVKEVINDCIVDQINKNSGKPFAGNKCTFKNPL